MDPPCSFIGGGGSRLNAGAGSGLAPGAGAGAGSDSVAALVWTGSDAFVGSGVLIGSGSFVAGADPTSTSFMPSPSYKLSIETLGGMPSLPANHSALLTAGFKPTVGG